MGTNGLNARPHRKFRVTTISGHKHEAAPTVVDGDFRPERQNQVWPSDVSYIATAEGWRYLFVIIDLYSRRVVGWAMSKSLGTTTLLQAFWMAVARRGAPEGLVFHSDRGVQYASTRFRNALRKKRFIQGMSREAAMQEAFEYIEVFDNRIRLQSTMDYRSPAEYEEASAQQAA